MFEYIAIKKQKKQSGFDHKKRSIDRNVSSTIWVTRTVWFYHQQDVNAHVIMGLFTLTNAPMCKRIQTFVSVMSQCLLLSCSFRKEKITRMFINWIAVFQEVGLVTQWAVYHCFTCSHIFVSFWWRLSPVKSLIALCCLTFLLYLVDAWQ